MEHTFGICLPTSKKCHELPDDKLSHENSESERIKQSEGDRANNDNDSRNVTTRK